MWTARRAKISPRSTRAFCPAGKGFWTSWPGGSRILPEGVTVSGLGMNEEEMGENPALSSHVVHDLNADPALPSRIALSTP